MLWASSKRRWRWSPGHSGRFAFITGSPFFEVPRPIGKKGLAGFSVVALKFRRIYSRICTCGNFLLPLFFFFNLNSGDHGLFRVILWLGMTWDTLSTYLLLGSKVNLSVANWEPSPPYCCFQTVVQVLNNASTICVPAFWTDGSCHLGLAFRGCFRSQGGTGRVLSRVELFPPPGLVPSA